MPYRVELTARAVRNLRRIYQTINAEPAAQARALFNGLEQAISSLDEHSARGPSTPKDRGLRHLLRAPLALPYHLRDEANRIVTVLNIRHGARGAFIPDDSDDSTGGPVRSG
ncbi:type II toxin-antitoxin system RelE/ParE family toxin [Rhodopila sp.]|uniref:type II toxin-antitoxin system RelE/ParE family toxin n=1 Tax=Rhodopila sp. TaxID=2480087 RepID=UPI003D11CFEF